MQISSQISSNACLLRTPRFHHRARRRNHDAEAAKKIQRLLAAAAAPLTIMLPLLQADEVIRNSDFADQLGGLLLGAKSSGRRLGTRTLPAPAETFLL